MTETAMQKLETYVRLLKFEEPRYLDSLKTVAHLIEYAEVLEHYDVVNFVGIQANVDGGGDPEEINVFIDALELGQPWQKHDRARGWYDHTRLQLSEYALGGGERHPGVEKLEAEGLKAVARDLTKTSYSGMRDANFFTTVTVDPGDGGGPCPLRGVYPNFNGVALIGHPKGVNEFDWLPASEEVAIYNLAFAILADAVSPEFAAKHYRTFRWEVLYKLTDPISWQLTGTEIQEWWAGFAKRQNDAPRAAAGRYAAS